MRGGILEPGDGPGAHPATVIAPNAFRVGLHAGQIVKESAKEMGGTGGGQPSYAMGAGVDVHALQRTVESARNFIDGKLTK